MYGKLSAQRLDVLQDAPRQRPLVSLRNSDQAIKPKRRVQKRDRIYLSPPHMGTRELDLVKDAFASNWLAPLGPHVDAFEREFSEVIGVPFAAALSSGTAAIHLALRLLGVSAGEEVLCSTLTFSASAYPILYERAQPVFIDADRDTWNMDPGLLREELRGCAIRGKMPRAVIVVDLYGQSADYDRILDVCAEYEVPVIEDAAEALGATYKGESVGGFGRLGVFSFNGNKIITTSGGGMLVSAHESLARQARFLAGQARDPAPHYEHSRLGFNYRMSNVLAAIGRGQLRYLKDRVEARRRNFDRYNKLLGDLPGLEFMPEAGYGRSNKWLTCVTLEPNRFGATAEDVRLALERDNIEARPIWKPLHLQPVFSGCRVRGGAVSEALFANGLCLPSGSSLKDKDLERIAEIVRRQSTG
jgi:pyridoxal phosphate-dependent aminotransferase EpsN